MNIMTLDALTFLILIFCHQKILITHFANFWGETNTAVIQYNLSIYKVTDFFLLFHRAFFIICLFNFYQLMHFYVIKILYKQLLM